MNTFTDKQLNTRNDRTQKSNRIVPLPHTRPATPFNVRVIMLRLYCIAREYVRKFELSKLKLMANNNSFIVSICVHRIHKSLFLNFLSLHVLNLDMPFLSFHLHGQQYRLDSRILRELNTITLQARLILRLWTIVYELTYSQIISPVNKKTMMSHSSRRHEQTGELWESTIWSKPWVYLLLEQEVTLFIWT
jgi:hypothetical protein